MIKFKKDFIMDKKKSPNNIINKEIIRLITSRIKKLTIVRFIG